MFDWVMNTSLRYEAEILRKDLKKHDPFYGIESRISGMHP